VISPVNTVIDKDTTYNCFPVFWSCGICTHAPAETIGDSVTRVPEDGIPFVATAVPSSPAPSVVLEPCENQTEWVFAPVFNGGAPGADWLIAKQSCWTPPASVVQDSVPKQLGQAPHNRMVVALLDL